MIVLVCGGRDYGDLESLKGNRAHPLWPQREAENINILTTLYKLALDWPKIYGGGNWLPKVTIITGGASGVDRAAADWAAINWAPCREYKADWTKHGKAAGPIRNQEMLDKEAIDLVVAFPGGTGTADMVRRAKAKGIKVLEIAAAFQPDTDAYTPAATPGHQR